MADHYNPFLEDNEDEVEDIITNSISTATENLEITEELPEETVDDVSHLKSELNYDAIAIKLIKDKLILTALELHTELTEAGRQLSPLRDFFSNPGNFEKQTGEQTLSLRKEFEQPYKTTGIRLPKKKGHYTKPTFGGSTVDSSLQCTLVTVGLGPRLQ